jgi:hypothetical protein
MSWNPTYSINLLELANRSYPERQQQRNVRVLATNAAFRRVLGNAVIDEIRHRTRDLNIDRFGRPFPKYSAGYVKSLQFKVYGKDAQDVNLTLSREMLASMRARGSSYDLVIQLDGQNNRDKAQGHVSGRYGKSKKIIKRDFLGLPPEVEQRIFKETVRGFSSQIPEVELELANVVGAQGTALAVTALDLLN